MRVPALTRTTAVAAGAALLALAGAGGGLLWLHARPVLHVASSAQECINAPDHVASLFSDDQNTLLRISNLDYTDLRVLRVEPAASLPGMFDSLLALSSDSRRLAYVTASDELMDGARIQYLDVASPQNPHPVAQVPRDLAPVRPAWSPNADQLAYVIGRAATASQPAAFEVWSARADGSQPAQKVSELPLDVFARGHSASLCWTAGGQIGLLEGVESASGQAAAASPLPTAASGARTQTPSPSPSAQPAQNGSPCGVPVFSQNDPSWRDQIMQAGGDPIGGYGCALTSTTMLLNYYGVVMTPADLNACLGGAADPIYWQSAPACTFGKVQGGERTDFTWEALDAFLGAGKPVIAGMVRGLTGMHFVVVTQGGGGEADNYHITDPWDGSTTKTLASYMDVGYNPRWIISYDGAGRNCARLVTGSGQSVGGFRDGGTYKGGVTVTAPGNGGTVVQRVPTGPPSGTTPSPSPSPSASPTPAPSPSPSPSPAPSASASASPSPSASPSASPTPKPSPTVWHINPRVKFTFTDEGIYLVYYRHPNGSFSILKFTIDHTAPVLSLLPLNVHPHLLAFHPAADDQPGVVLDQPGKLRLGALDTLSGVDGISYALDGAPWTAYSDDVSFKRTLVVPAPGAHSISIRATDMAGNTAELDDQPFQVVAPNGPTPTPSPTPSETPTPTGTPTPPGVRSTPTPRGTPTPTPRQTPTPTPTPTPVPPSFVVTSVTGTTQQPFCTATYTVSGTIANQGGTGSVTYGWSVNHAPPQVLSTTIQAGSSAAVTDPNTVQVQQGATVSVTLEIIGNTGSQMTTNLTCQIIP